MVLNWSPEPPREIEEVSFNNSGVTLYGPTSSDSDGDDFSAAHEGYEPLSNFGVEEAENEVTDSDSVGDDTEWFEQQNGDLEGDQSRDSLPQVDSASLSQLWAGPARDIVLGADGAAAVRAAMEGFSLPEGSLPPWASSIPEEEWTGILQQRITLLQGRQPE